MQKSEILSSASEYIDLSTQANEPAAKDNDLPSHLEVLVLPSTRSADRFLGLSFYVFDGIDNRNASNAPR